LAGTCRARRRTSLFAAIEATAFQTRIILERMAQYRCAGAPRDQRRRHPAEQSRLLNQVYANVLNKPVLVPDGVPTSLGIGDLCDEGRRRVYPTITAAQDALCLPYKVIEPQPDEAARAEELFRLYRDVYLSRWGCSTRPRVRWGMCCRSSSASVSRLWHRRTRHSGSG
jgi:L-ribulokinase